MPSFVKRALHNRELMGADRSRPVLQQNDYIAWINQAQRSATRQRRLQELLDELERGGLYMNDEEATAGMALKSRRQRSWDRWGLGYHPAAQALPPAT